MTDANQSNQQMGQGPSYYPKPTDPNRIENQRRMVELMASDLEDDIKADPSAANIYQYSYYKTFATMMSFYEHMIRNHPSATETDRTWNFVKSYLERERHFVNLKKAEAAREQAERATQAE